MRTHPGNRILVFGLSLGLVWAHLLCLCGHTVQAAQSPISHPISYQQLSTLHACCEKPAETLPFLKTSTPADPESPSKPHQPHCPHCGENESPGLMTERPTGGFHLHPSLILSFDSLFTPIHPTIRPAQAVWMDPLPPRVIPISERLARKCVLQI
ncbi:MAG: hypothetical protein KatS3mg104_0350 [Phycisphaerae bacterium]|jgi:hypothetical protein|nr:MAG: hypothetical protein KatS3mg104_0350 [Phycisphaerae bacterium]